MAPETRAFTVRLPADQADVVETLAQVDEMSVAQVVRSALDDRIAARRADPDFAARLQKTMARNRRALERLSE